MSKTAWIALLLALGLGFALCGCKSGDDDDAPAEDDDATVGDDDTIIWDDDDGDDDDVGPHASLDSFEPLTIVLGETPPFVATGSFCDGTEICFIPVKWEAVCVEDYTLRETKRIEGTIPAGLQVGVYGVGATCSTGAPSGLSGSIEVVEEDPADDDSA